LTEPSQAEEAGIEALDVGLTFVVQGQTDTNDFQ
jgi:hypothetical protein